jgi:ribose 5-phosphate isomerase RpiB
LKPLDLPQDARRVATVIKTIAAEVKSGNARAAVLMVQSGAAAVVFANRCPSLRAVLGTCLESVEQGLQHVAANVLVIEYPHRTLQQMKNMLGRFVRAKHELPEDVRRQLQELASCG